MLRVFLDRLFLGVSCFFLRGPVSSCAGVDLSRARQVFWGFGDLFEWGRERRVVGVLITVRYCSAHFFFFLVLSFALCVVRSQVCRARFACGMSAGHMCHGAGWIHGLPLERPGMLLTVAVHSVTAKSSSRISGLVGSHQCHVKVALIRCRCPGFDVT